jgi:hypothetical protein
MTFNWLSYSVSVSVNTLNKLNHIFDDGFQHHIDSSVDANVLERHAVSIIRAEVTILNPLKNKIHLSNI